jgi:hypothetical protein
MATTEKKAEPQFSEQELEQMLEEKRKEKAAAREKLKAKYEYEKEFTIDTLINQALEINQSLLEFKNEAHIRLLEFSELMHMYGKLRNEGKGNFSIINEAGTKKVVFKIQNRKSFNELAGLAETHLRNFIQSFVKVRNHEAYTFISSILERNAKGEYDIALINRLYKMENDYHHPDWKEAIRLFKEAYQEIDSRSYITFYHRVESGEWRLINLNFASISLA